MNDSIFKLDFNNGKVIWKNYLRGTYSNHSPKFKNDNVIFSGAESIISLNLDGKKLWEEQTYQKTKGLVIKDSILFNTRTNEGIFANSINTGKEYWNIKPDYQMLSMSNPLLIDSLLILGNFDYKENIGKHLTCINIDNQKIKWQIENKGYLNGESIIQNNHLIVNSDSAYKKGFTYKIDLLTGKKLWETMTNPVIFYKSQTIDNKILVPSYESGIVCMNDQTGQIQWKMNKEFYPSTELVFHNNTLYFGTTNRVFVGVNLNGEIIFKSSFNYGIGNPFIHNNAVYVNDGNGKLFRVKDTVANNAYSS
jgi:outer membrane protein assembly factor BamB